MSNDTKQIGPVDVLAVLDAEIERAGGQGFPVGRTIIAARAAVAELIEAAASVVADVRAHKEPDLIELADCIKAAGGRAALKAALVEVQGKAYTLADHARVGGAS